MSVKSIVNIEKKKGSEAPIYTIEYVKEDNSVSKLIVSTSASNLTTIIDERTIVASFTPK
jgi:hypothetical protein